MNLESQLPLVLDLCLKSSAILLAAFAIAGIARKTSAARRHLIWLAAFTTLALLPLTLAFSPRWSWSLQRPVQTRSIILNTIPIATHELADFAPTAAPTRQIWNLPSRPTIAAAAWLAGALLLLTRQTAGFWKLRSLRQQSSAITSGPAVEIASEFGDAEMRESSLCTVPLTWGWRRPVVLLPESASSWPEAQLRAALAHEFGHIARRDFLWRQCAQIVRAFFWPNPFVWLAVRALHRTQEEACDDLALSHGASPREYAMQLLEAARSLASPKFPSAQAVAIALPSTLQGRVRAVVDERRDRRAPGRVARIFASSVVVAMIAASAVAQIKDKEEPNPKPAAPLIAFEIRVIAAPEGARDVFIGGKSTGSPPMFSPDDFQRGLQNLAQMDGVETLSTPKVITRSRQLATVEIAAPKDGPPRPGMKFDVLADFAADGLFQLAFTYTSEFPDADKIKTRVLKSNVSLEPGHTLLLSGTNEVPGRETLVTVTASLVSPKKLDPAKNAMPEERPVGKKIPGKAGFVTSPFAPDAGEIDVRGLPPGTEIKDPRSGKIFFFPTDESAALVAAKKIILPRFEMKEATVSETIRLIERALRGEEEPPDRKREVNIVLKSSPKTDAIKFSFALTGASLAEILKHIADLANLELSADENAVVLSPPDSPIASQEKPDSGTASPKTTAKEKAETIVIPRINFKDANVAEALDFLRRKVSDLDPERKGVNFVLMTGRETGTAKVTLNLKNIPLVML